MSDLAMWGWTVFVILGLWALMAGSGKGTR
jgi:hypothetical protein